MCYVCVLDSSCLIWDSSCGRKGNCALYNKSEFRLYMNVTAACKYYCLFIYLDAIPHIKHGYAQNPEEREHRCTI